MSIGLSFKDTPKEVVRMKNTSGAQVVAGDICVLKAVAAGDEITTTTTGGDNQLLRGGGFMAVETIANNAYGRFLRRGFTTALKVDGTTDIAIGDRLTSFTSAGIAKKAAVGDPYFAIALEAYTTNDSLGVIDAILLEPGAEDPYAGASGGTPALILGTANSAGSAATFIRDDDTILAFDATAPTTSAVGDSAATGAAAVAARRDHTHGRESFATNAIVLGTVAAAGAATTPMRSNDTIAAFDATVPSTQAFGDSAATGSAAFAARRDHVHGMPTGLSLIATGNLAAQNSTLTVSSIPAKTFLRIVIFANYNSVNGTILLRFNADSGANYAYKPSGGATTSGATAITMSTFTGEDEGFMIDVRDYTSYQKPVYIQRTVEANSASFDGATVWGLWNNTADQISSVTLTSGSGNNFAAGTQIDVYG